MDRSIWANKTFLCVVEIFLESFQYPEKNKNILIWFILRFSLLYSSQLSEPKTQAKICGISSTSILVRTFNRILWALSNSYLSWQNVF